MNLVEAKQWITKTPKGYGYCYILCRPNQEPFYVGIGRNGRLAQHELVSNQKQQRNPHKDRIINKIKAAGREVFYIFDCFSKDHNFLKEREIELIAKYGRSCTRGILLTNITAGGDGALGRKTTKSQSEKMSLRTKAMWEDPAFQVMRSESARAQCIERHKDPASRAAVSENFKKWWQVPENREAAKAERKARYEQPGVKEALSKTLKLMHGTYGLDEEQLRLRANSMERYKYHLRRVYPKNKQFVITTSRYFLPEELQGLLE